MGSKISLTNKTNVITGTTCDTQKSNNPNSCSTGRDSVNDDYNNNNDIATQSADLALTDNWCKENVSGPLDNGEKEVSYSSNINESYHNDYVNAISNNAGVEATRSKINPTIIINREEPQHQLTLKIPELALTDIFINENVMSRLKVNQGLTKDINNTSNSNLVESQFVAQA